MQDVPVVATIYGPQRDVDCDVNLLHVWASALYSAAGNTRDCVEIRSVLAEAPQVVPARRRMSENLYVTVPATS